MSEQEAKLKELLDILNVSDGEVWFETRDEILAMFRELEASRLALLAERLEAGKKLVQYRQALERIKERGSWGHGLRPQTDFEEVLKIANDGLDAVKENKNDR